MHGKAQRVARPGELTVMHWAIGDTWLLNYPADYEDVYAILPICAKNQLPRSEIDKRTKDLSKRTIYLLDSNFIIRQLIKDCYWLRSCICMCSVFTFSIFQYTSGCCSMSDTLINKYICMYVCVYVQGAAKKVAPKVFCRFLSNCLEVCRNFFTNLYTVMFDI